MKLKLILKLRKELRQGNFEKIYNTLSENNFVYTIDNIFYIFKKCNVFAIYSFLMYSISKEESSDKHMVICQCLMYGDPYILEADNMIYWHVNRAIDYDSDYLPIMKWVLANYGSCPTSPFNGNELLALAKKIIEKDPENWIAKRFL